MKRHFWLIFFLILELIYSIAMLFNYNTLLLLLISNIILILLLMLEPYWKIGAWLLYFISIEVFLFILNEKILEFYISMHLIINIAALILGLILVLGAYFLKLRDENAKLENFPEETDDLENRDNENIENTKKTDSGIVKPNIISKILISSKNTVHLKDCETLKKAKDARIVNERYAKAMKMKECKTCKPYSSENKEPNSS